MIAGIFHQGSGLGNQLHRYVATRVLARDKGYDFGMFCTEDGSGKELGFKGMSFMKLDMGQNPTEVPEWTEWNEKKVMENGVDIRGYDPEINFVNDNTIIDGEFQDLRYFSHRMREIEDWLKVEPLDVSDDTCVIGFRGGEYKAIPDLYLPHSYYQQAIDRMKERGINKFEVHTDDTEEAGRFFSYLGVSIIHDIGINWRSMRYAKNAIIANSSFFILPRLIQHWGNGQALTIAPRYWARHNTKTWALPQNYYEAFSYI